MTTWSPREDLTPVSRDLAKPRKPPTPVGPVGLAACAGSDAAPSVRLFELLTGDPVEEEGKMSEVETRGAGRTETNRTATTATAAPVAPRVSHGIPLDPDMDCHMATSPHTPKATQATTYPPSVRSTDGAAAPAMSAAEPASE